jgi:hypothetical protein
MNQIKWKTSVNFPPTLLPNTFSISSPVVRSEVIWRIKCHKGLILNLFQKYFSRIHHQKCHTCFIEVVVDFANNVNAVTFGHIVATIFIMNQIQLIVKICLPPTLYPCALSTSSATNGSKIIWRIESHRCSIIKFIRCSSLLNSTYLLVVVWCSTSMFG